MYECRSDFLPHGRLQTGANHHLASIALLIDKQHYTGQQSRHIIIGKQAIIIDGLPATD